MQDSRGQMYFITFGGLSIYDGVRFKNYRKQDGLANELVNDIIEISPDSFLIASNTPLLNTLVNGKIGHFKTGDNFCPVINKFLKSNDGSIYVVADEGLFSLQENKFIKIPLKDVEGLDIGGNLDRITEWNQYLIMIPWNIIQKEKLIVYDKAEKRVIGTITDHFINSAEVAPNGDLWLSTSTDLKVLDSKSLQEGKINLRSLAANFENRNLSNSSLYTDRKKNLCILRQTELIIISSSGEITTFSADHGMRSGNFSDVFVDREGITWIASDGNGIVKMTGTNVQLLDDFIPGVKNNIAAIYQQLDTTWVFNRTDHSFYRIYQKQLSIFPLVGNKTSIWQFFVVNKSIYFTSWLEIFRIENKDMLSSYNNPEKIIPGGLVVHGYASGITDPYGNLIQAGTIDDSIFTLMVIDHQQLKMKLPLSYLGDQMAIDRQKNLWVPTRDHHLLAFSLHPENPDKYLQLKYDLSTHVEGIDPRSMAIDSNGNLWIGTRYNGIYFLQLKDQVFQSTIQITAEQGLTDNFIYQLHCDPHNNIWAGSQTGLDKISYRDGEIIVENITKSKNIFQGIHKIINVASDVIWAMTPTGDVIMVAEDKDGPSRHLPTLFINALSVNDQEYDLRENLFKHHQNNLTISVAAPSFLDEKSIKYSYRLKGSGKNTWSEPSNTADFNFINLDYGNYELSIRAEFPAKMYPIREIRYAFTIRPPFYRTWWFASLLVLIILFLTSLIIRYYYAVKLETQRRILERKQAIEKERTRIATDMHDDLGAGLSRIKFLSETIGIKKQQHLPIEQEITSIRRYAHEMIDKMGEIVWALNEKNDSLSDLLSYTRAYAMEYLAENGITAKIDKLPVIASMKVNGEFRRNIYLSVKEALHNVVKHARAGTVTIRFEVNEQLHITILDNGIGFNQEKNASFGNGISNIKKRMAEIGGELSIIQDNGTVITLTAPLPQ